MMPNITRGGRMDRLMSYLVDVRPEKTKNVHADPHLVAGDAAIMAWHDDAQLNRPAALEIARQLDLPRVAFGTRVTVPVKDKEGQRMRGADGRALLADAHVWHCSLSLRPDETALSDEQWAHIAEDFVAGMGFADAGSETPPCRWVAVRHGPSKGGNDHVHVVVGLVREDGTAASVWQDKPNAQRVAGELERKYGLQVLESREVGHAGRGQARAERETAQRRGAAETAGQQLARTVRACAAAAGSEAEFVRRVRAEGVLIRPRYAAGTDSVVTGYSVALRPARGAVGDGQRPAPVWYGGGRLARDLTLPRLRAGWPDTPQDADAAAAEWRAAKRNQRPVAAGPEAAVPDEAMWARYTQQVEGLRERLASVPLDDRELWAHVARDTAGAFAAWSLRTEAVPGPLAQTADILARSAQLRAFQVRPRRAELPSVSGAALLLASVGHGGKGTVAQAVLLRQLAKTVLALRDAHVAAGDAARAAEITRAVHVQLASVSGGLPALSPEQARPVVADAQAAEAARIAAQGQLPARAPGTPVPGALKPPSADPEERPAVTEPQKPGVER